jgi:tryptophan synthase beta chain
MEAAMELTRLEGIIPAIESAHAVAVLKKEKFSKDDVVVVTISGRGDKDMEAYSRYFETTKNKKTL